MKRIDDILKEALDVFDFDSWDDSEKAFKDNINAKLSMAFIYKIDYVEPISIFSGYINGAPSWELFNSYKNSAFLNGIRLEIHRNGCTAKNYPPGEYSIIINDVNKIEDACYMFCGTDIKIVPSFKAKIIDMDYMFCQCERLIHVPELYIGNVYSWDHMFEDSMDNLDEETLDFWNPDAEGTPQIE